MNDEEAFWKKWNADYLARQSRFDRTILRAWDGVSARPYWGIPLVVLGLWAIGFCAAVTVLATGLALDWLLGLVLG